jgi:hypothetical protein
MAPARSQSRWHRTRRSARPLSAALALGVACLCAAAPARADTGSRIIERCTHGQPLGGFSQQDYRRALAELPTEVEEYSDCGNLIRRAQLAAAGAGSPAGVGAGTIATPLTPAEQRRVGSIARTPARPVLIGTQVVHPGVIHADISSALNSLPNALIAILAVVLTGVLTLAGRAIRDLVADRRPH